MDGLPIEIHILILSFLSLEDIWILTQVNRFFRSLGQSELPKLIRERVSKDQVRNFSKSPPYISPSLFYQILQVHHPLNEYFYFYLDSFRKWYSSFHLPLLEYLEKSYYSSLNSKRDSKTVSYLETEMIRLQGKYRPYYPTAEIYDRLVFKKEPIIDQYFLSRLPLQGKEDLKEEVFEEFWSDLFKYKSEVGEFQFQKVAAELMKYECFCSDLIRRRKTLIWINELKKSHFLARTTIPYPIWAQSLLLDLEPKEKTDRSASSN